eukprot:4050340-Heterocapsa_arctica.AAC.1
MGSRARATRHGSRKRRIRGAASKTGWSKAGWKPPEPEARRRESAIRPRAGHNEDRGRGDSQPG